MPGYSGTPLPKKLGIKDNLHVCLVDAPSEVVSELMLTLNKCTTVADHKSPIDFAMVFTKSASMLTKKLKQLTKQLSPAGMVWVSWPKKTSGVPTDLNENIVRKIGLAAGLVDVKVCAVTEVWSGLRFVRRLKDR